MNTIEDRLAFVNIKSRRKQIRCRIAIYVIIIMTLAPIGYGIYKILMLWDYSKLKHRIEYDIMNGWDKLYDCNLSLDEEYYIQDNDYNNPKNVYRHSEIEREVLDVFLFTSSSWINNKKILRYSDPSKAPFSFTSIEKNTQGGYDIKRITALGIGYVTSAPHPTSPVYEFLTELDNPTEVYKKAFHYLDSPFYNEYRLEKGKDNDICSILTPTAYTASRKGYNDTHVTSLFHAIDRQNKKCQNGEWMYGFSATGQVKNDRNSTFYNIREDYLKIIEHPYNSLGKILLITFSILICLGLLILILSYKKIQKQLELSGIIWTDVSKQEAIIIKFAMVGKPQIRFIDRNNDRKLTFKYSKDRSKILLEDGEIYSLNIIYTDSNKEEIEYIELKNESISRIYHGTDSFKE